MGQFVYVSDITRKMLPQTQYGFILLNYTTCNEMDPPSLCLM